MDSASFRCLIFLSLLVPIVTAPAAGKHVFEITLDIYSGGENPNTTITATGPPFESFIVKSLLALDVHQAHAGHDGHAGHVGPVKQQTKELPSVNGYKGLIIKHTLPDGGSHTMTIAGCDHYPLQVKIALSMRSILSMGAKSQIRSVLQKCWTAGKKPVHSHTDGHKHKH